MTTAPARLESIARDPNTMRGLLVFPGQPCPCRGCRGHLRTCGSMRATCDHCFWSPEEGISMSQAALDRWMRRCATDAIPAHQAVSLRLEPTMEPDDPEPGPLAA